MSGYHKRDLDPFPMHKIKRVERPTTKIFEDQIQRFDEREHGFHRAGRGDYGQTAQQGLFTFVWKHPISSALVEMEGNFVNLVDGPVAARSSAVPDDPAILSRHIKETAYFLRSDAVGICKLPPYAVYSHNSAGEPIELDHKYAIAILIDQDAKTAEASTGSDYISNSMSFVAYTASSFISCILANYIRKLGYRARAHHQSNHEVVFPPILLWAGLGEMCRINGCVLHPFLSTRFKAAVVTTDMPLIPDKPIDFGLQDFCAKCKKCARECPSQCLSYEGKVMHNGYEAYAGDVRKCTTQRVSNKRGSSCGTCITVCPWTKPYTPFHRAVGWAMRHSGIARSLAIWGDDLMGYGKADLRKRWWFDVEFDVPDGKAPI
jgi:reductive dehalogenase